MQTKSIDTPLAELTLRRYEKPHGTKRELVRKFCLSIGMLQPGDSRDIIVDILYVLLDARKEKKLLSSEEIRDLVLKLRKDEKLDDLGTAASNIRRQLKRLRRVFLVEKVKNDYRMTEFLPASEIYQEKIEKFLLPSIIERVKDYFKEVDSAFPEKPL